MIKAKDVRAELRRDATYVWHAAIAVVFIVFAGLALTAALLDLWTLHH